MGAYKKNSSESSPGVYAASQGAYPNKTTSNVMKVVETTELDNHIQESIEDDEQSKPEEDPSQSEEHRWLKI